MQNSSQYYGEVRLRALIVALGILGSAPALASTHDVPQASALAVPAFLGGLALPAAASPTPQGPAYAAFDAEAVALHLGVVAEEAPGVDPIQTAAIIPGVFGSVAIPMKNFPVSARWAPIYRAIDGCAGSACGGASRDFTAIVAAARDKGFREKLDRVNRGVNRLISYKRDKAVYGRLDHWAQPAEILKRAAGDCEDFAILKMAALIDAGIPAQSMALVVLQDSQKGVFHAVLSVATGSGTFILDNVRDNVVIDNRLPAYVPLYSFSTNRAWIHGSKAGSAQVAQTREGLTSIAPGEGPQEPRRPGKAGWMPAKQG